MKKSILKFNLLLVASIFCFTIFSGCDKITEHSLKFDMSSGAVEITVTPSTGTYELNTSIPINVDSICSAHHFDSKDIKGIVMIGDTASIIDTTTVNPYTFNLLRTFEGRVTSAGKPDILAIADYDITAQNEILTGFNVVTGTDIHSLIGSNKFSLNIKGELKLPIQHLFKLRLRIAYHVTVTSTNPLAQ